MKITAFDALIGEVKIPKYKGMSVKNWFDKNKKKRKERQYKNRIPKTYNIYIKSEFWRKRRNDFYQKFGRKCIICGSSKFINVHHMIYRNYGFEKDEDLVVFCHDHHELFHSLYDLRGNMFKETNEFIIEQIEKENFPVI